MVGKQHFIEVLLVLASRGCMDSHVVVRTRELAGAMKRSQQSASSYLVEMEQTGLIDRIHSGRASSTRITDKGRGLLTDRYDQYRELFEGNPSSRLTLTGRVVSGFGEGSYYVSLGHYSRQIREKLGFQAFTGTFNIELKRSDVPSMARLASAASITLAGFEEGGRTFGKVKCHRCLIEGVEGAIIMPERTHYSDRIEVISPVYLRGTLGKNEGDEIKVEVELKQ